jgi:hypothetical protein
LPQTKESRTTISPAPIAFQHNVTPKVRNDVNEALPGEVLRLIVCDTLLTAYGSEISAAAQDIQVVFDRCLLFVPLDEGASLADQRAVLARLTAEQIREGTELDDAVSARIAMFLPDKTRGTVFAGDDLPDDTVLATAIAQARLSLDPIPRGRPAGTMSLCAQQLALGLGFIWYDWTGTPPTRSVIYDAETNRYREGGPFHSFVTAVADVAPSALRKTRKGHVPSVDNLVRLAVHQYNLAKAKDLDDFRRGLLDESAWLGTPYR